MDIRIGSTTNIDYTGEKNDLSVSRVPAFEKNVRIFLKRRNNQALEFQKSFKIVKKSGGTKILSEKRYNMWRFFCR